MHAKVVALRRVISEVLLRGGASEHPLLLRHAIVDVAAAGGWFVLVRVLGDKDGPAAILGVNAGGSPVIELVIDVIDYAHVSRERRLRLRTGIGRHLRLCTGASEPMNRQRKPRAAAGHGR